MWTIKNEMNKHSKGMYLYVDAENKQMIARGEENGERREIGVEDQDVQNSSCTINESQVYVQCGEFCITK